MTRVLVAGDHFVTPDLVTAALDARRDRLGELDVRTHTGPWPHTPFGPVAEVDEASDIEDELTAGHLRAAAFDVFDTEPLPAYSPLRAAPNIVVTPHLAGATVQTAERAAGLAADAFVTWLASRP
ncbi:hypothetical protein HDA40_008102 [Hamadaea flava]|uniref:NAD(P)-dependent oxidoreductase n=1 Tax=Hamadaea flava TaxID=1742688 RepID=A0ABV8LNA7_9ACTN|nr:NAD(P)-dependent oxidoreductase [Hamadaea flava]MCP2329595.1 hypothetical protein [Hamadaea flava]